MFIIKVTLGNDSRRVAVEKMMPFSTLQQLIKNMYAVELSATPVIRYRDDENDLVAITSDLELQEALRQIPEQDGMKMLRLYLNEGSASFQAGQSISASAFTDLGVSSPVSPAAESQSAPSVPVVAAVPSAPATAAPKVESIVSQSSPSQIPSSSASNAAPAPKPAVAPAQLAHDLSVIALIEKQLQEAFKAVTTFMTALEFDTKMVEVLDGCHKAFTEVSEAAQSKIIVPLQNLTKSKSGEFSKEIEKFQAELKRLREQLKVEVNKALETLSNSVSSSSSSAPQEACPAPAPVAPAAAAPAPVAAEPAQAPSVYPAVPQEEKLPEDAAQEDLNKLAEMGFVDRVRNLELLAKHQGNILAVVEDLLNA